MDKISALKEWLKIEYYCMAKKLGFIDKEVCANQELVFATIRVIDYETTMMKPIDINSIIALLALMWEHIDNEKYNLKDFILKMLSRIGYPTSAIIVDKNFNTELNQFSATNSVFDKCTLTLFQSRNEVTVGDQQFLLTAFQKQLWNSLDTQRLLGISAPTSAGKSFVILIKTIEKMRQKPLDVIYIVPTLSLLNQVTEDYNNMLIRLDMRDYLITNNLEIGESKARNTIYVWTQEKAISALSSDSFEGMPNKTILVVDEVQNIERITEDTDVRAKILFDTLQELRYSANVEQIIISGPRINRISELGKSLFGEETKELSTFSSPVLNLTYSVKKEKTKYCNGVQREHNKKLNNGLPILHKVPPKRDYGRYFCIMAEKGGTSHGGLTEKLSLFFHAKKQEVNAYGR